jgi:hypothetical protein
LEPATIETRRDIEGPIPESTHRRDYNGDGFDCSVTPQQVGRIAGLVVKQKSQGLQYGSDNFHQKTARPIKGNKREVGIFSAGEGKLRGIQKFRDELHNDPNSALHDQEIIRKPIHAELTIPIAGI